jgi:ATP-binding cassette subfamily B protein
MGTFGRLLTYMFKHRLRLVVVVIGIILGTAVNLIGPWIIKTAIDGPIKTGDLSSLGLLSVAVIGVALLGFIVQYLQRYSSELVSQRVSFDLRADIYRSLMEQSFSFYDRSRTGQIMSRATSDIGQVQGFLGFGFRMIITSALTFTGVLAIVILMDWRLTILSLGVMPFMSLMIYRFSTKVGPLWENIREQYGSMTSILQENISGVRVVKAFTGEEQEEAKFSRENRSYFEKLMVEARLRSVYFPLVDFIAGIGAISIIWYGGSEVIAGQLSLGSMAAFSAYLMQLLWPLRSIGSIMTFYKTATAAAARIFQIIDSTPEVLDVPDAKPLDGVKGDVRFEDVSFGYDEENTVLKDLNLEVKAGESVAILGPTGSGKSSIISLLPRFYDVKKGRITIDGQDIRKVTKESLRRQIAVVHQEPFIFSTTLKSNIAFGTNAMPLEKIIAAAKAAQIHDFIVRLPEGYETEVGERGVTLSGGQKQRIAIARALLADPRILIFDDSTSSVDTDTDYEIQQALERLRAYRTTFIITQRLSTIKGVNKIIFLNEGEVVEEGTHEELMAKRGWYYQLYKTQVEEATAEG